MGDILDSIRRQVQALPEHMTSAIDLDLIIIESGAIQAVAPYLKEKGYRNVIIAEDPTTFIAAGQELEGSILAAGISCYRTLIKPDDKGDVIADEASLIQLILDIQQHKAQVVLAVGGGTLHDISRYSAYTAGIPFISVPTAPSVDGFNSKGAPIIIRGEKHTIPAIGPDAIFADINILTEAPSALVAAGFGDMLGKYTSLFDWKFSSLAAGEPYLQASADITMAALIECVNAVEEIAKRSEQGITILMRSLIESGLAMLLFGQSHPASGAEHHLSHYWEMEYIRLGKKQLLHGAKVGVACMEISDLYHRIADEGASKWENQNIIDQWDVIVKEIRDIPDRARLGDLLKIVGGPTSIEELGVSIQLLQRSLSEAHQVRLNRYTLLRANNEK